MQFQLTDTTLRNWIIFLAALLLLLVTLGGAALTGWLFFIGAQVNSILIAFVGFALGTLVNLVQHALGFNQGVSVSTPVPTTLESTTPAVVSTPQ